MSNCPERKSENVFKEAPLTTSYVPKEALLTTSISVRIPAEVEPYTHDLRRFIDAMIYKLKVHSNKGKWEGLPIEKALELLQGEAAELKEAVEGGNLVEILTEAADVANYALIIASIATERGK